MTRIGRYEVEGEIGRGAMGVVYVAHDPRLRRRVAVKTFSFPEGLSPREMREFRKRFFREARAAAGLTHPGIVTVYDAAEDPDQGISYIAMELVPGRTLREWLEAEKRLKPERVFAMADILAGALQAAHEAGIVHRDLKPANILVRDEDDAVKVADFGIARVSTSKLTHAGSTLGSPAYMSPEQIQGHPLDGRSDLFSLGVILYESLCGERPFAGEDLPALAYSVVHETPLPISRRVQGLPKGLDRFFGRALAKDPSIRFPDGVAFRQALVRALGQVDPAGAEATVVDSHEARLSGEERPPRFRRWVILAASLILGGLLGGWALWASEDTYLQLDAKSSISSGTLTLLVDDREVYSRELFVDGRGLIKKMAGKSQESFETWIEVDPGKHEVTAHIVTESRPSGYMDTIVVDLKRGETRRLRLSAGRAFGAPVLLRID